MSTPTLEYISPRRIDFAPDAHIVLSVVRDEALRLPYLLTYYRNLGFDRFIFVDNGSVDGTRELLLRQPDAAVFYTEDRFGTPPNDALAWKNTLLDRFCDGRWVLVTDADEILVWPGSERENIRALTAKMSAAGADVLFTQMLDMYSDKPFGEIGYRAGEPFIDYTPYFDRGPYFFVRAPYCPFMQVWGGVRARIWKNQALPMHPPMLGKVPFLRWRAGQRFVAAQHMILKPLSMAMKGALLHFKMFDDLAAKCDAAIESGEHYQNAREYRVLRAAIHATAGKSFFDPAISLRYSGTDQLANIELVEAEPYWVQA